MSTRITESAVLDHKWIVTGFTREENCRICGTALRSYAPILQSEEEKNRLTIIIHKTCLKKIVDRSKDIHNNLSKILKIYSIYRKISQKILNRQEIYIPLIFLKCTKKSKLIDKEEYDFYSQYSYDCIKSKTLPEENIEKINAKIFSAWFSSFKKIEDPEPEDAKVQEKIEDQENKTPYIRPYFSYGTFILPVSPKNQSKSLCDSQLLDGNFKGSPKMTLKIKKSSKLDNKSNSPLPLERNPSRIEEDPFQEWFLNEMSEQPGDKKPSLFDEF